MEDVFEGFEDEGADAGEGFGEGSSNFLYLVHLLPLGFVQLAVCGKHILIGELDVFLDGLQVPSLFCDHFVDLLRYFCVVLHLLQNLIQLLFAQLQVHRFYFLRHYRLYYSCFVLPLLLPTHFPSPVPYLRFRLLPFVNSLFYPVDFRLYSFDVLSLVDVGENLPFIIINNPQTLDAFEPNRPYDRLLYWIVLALSKFLITFLNLLYYLLQFAHNNY